MYLFGLISTGIGEAVVMYVLGLPLARALKRSPLVEQLEEPEHNDAPTTSQGGAEK